MYYTDSEYTLPIRSVDNTASYDSTQGSQDDPYVKSGANGFRLPTSNEWLLAARYIDDLNSDGDIMDEGEFYPGNYASGATDDFNNDEACKEVAWYGGNSNTISHEVATKPANALGLSDMSGNIMEWCFDWSPDYIGTERTWRGGSYASSASSLQLGDLADGNPDYKDFYRGFRPARTP